MKTTNTYNNIPKKQLPKFDVSYTCNTDMHTASAHLIYIAPLWVPSGCYINSHVQTYIGEYVHTTNKQ